MIIMAAKFNLPKEFDFLPENWPEWISRWSRFRTVSKLNTEEEGVQIDSLIYSNNQFSPVSGWEKKK